MPLSEIQTYIDETEKNPSLFEERSFDQRLEVIDFIGFGLIDQIEKILPTTASPQKLIQLRVLRREALKRRIRVITYGPCTPRVALENWLERVTPGR